MTISLDALNYQQLYSSTTQVQTIRTQTQNNLTQVGKTNQGNQGNQSNQTNPATQNTQTGAGTNEAANGVRLTLSQEAQQLRVRMRTFETQGNQNNNQGPNTNTSTNTNTGSATGANSTVQNTGNLQSKNFVQGGSNSSSFTQNVSAELPVNNNQPAQQGTNPSSNQNAQQNNGVQNANTYQVQQYQNAIGGFSNAQSGFTMNLFR